MNSSEQNLHVNLVLIFFAAQLGFDILAAQLGFDIFAAQLGFDMFAAQLGFDIFAASHFHGDALTTSGLVQIWTDV